MPLSRERHSRRRAALIPAFRGYFYCLMRRPRRRPAHVGTRGFSTTPLCDTFHYRASREFRLAADDDCFLLAAASGRASFHCAATPSATFFIATYRSHILFPFGIYGDSAIISVPSRDFSALPLIFATGRAFPTSPPRENVYSFLVPISLDRPCKR